jgi:hypothetical protein
MLVPFGIVSGVIVVVMPMVSRVIVIVHLTFSHMRMMVGVLVRVLMPMTVPVLVRMFLVSVGMLMDVGVIMLVRMHMGMLVFAFHCRPPFQRVHDPFMGSLTLY